MTLTRLFVGGAPLSFRYIHFSAAPGGVIKCFGWCSEAIPDFGWCCQLLNGRIGMVSKGRFWILLDGIFEGIKGHVLDDIRRQILDGEEGLVFDIIDLSRT